jgi:hypothetical protein
MATIEFYDVKLRAKVQIDESDVKKKKYERETKTGSVQVRYALRANNNGTNLTKFISKETFDSLNAPEEA